MKKTVLLVAAALTLKACFAESPSNQDTTSSYLDYSGRDDVLSGGVKMIPVDTSKGTFRVWTKRIGNHPTMKTSTPAASEKKGDRYLFFMPRDRLGGEADAAAYCDEARI